MPITNDTNAYLLQEYEEPDRKRKDIVEELNKQLSTMIEDYPVFNKELWNMLFFSSPMLDTIHICPVVGTKKIGYQQKTENALYLMIDLIHVANYTQLVSQMVYILQNYITLELAKICIQGTYPTQPTSYIDSLNQFAFTNGLANYLAWNESCDDYQFSSDKYEPHKEKAFGLLAQAIDIQDPQVQYTIVENIVTADFWNQFPSVAGMFYFHDIYQEQGKEGILTLFTQGPQAFIQTIFSS